MALFQCENCGCRENTAYANQGFKDWPEDYDWSDIPNREGLMLCSECGPSHYKGGGLTGYGIWHGKFEQVFLPMGMFKTNAAGNLEHRETGDTDFMKYRTT